MSAADKKAFLLRLDPAVWAAIERLAVSDLRSVNAEIEYLLRDALRRRNVVAPHFPDPASEPAPASTAKTRARRVD
jgi:hypothetical protein